MFMKLFVHFLIEMGDIFFRSERQWRDTWNRTEKMKKNFVTAINNTNKMYPPLFLNSVEYTICERKILYIYVPSGTQVSRCSGRIYDRNNESDIDITDNEELVNGETDMKRILEIKENYILQRQFRNRAHRKFLFSVEIYPGIVAEFGEAKSKLESKNILQ